MFPGVLLASLLTIHPKVLGHGLSEYVSEFGMRVANEPLKIQARVLNAPKLSYHKSSKQPIAVRAFSFSSEEMISSICLEAAKWRMGFVGRPAMASFVISQFFPEGLTNACFPHLPLPTG